MARYVDYAKIPMQKNDIDAKTIGEYFEKLLLTLWDEQEDFSGKRPFGNGGWEYDVYAALISAGVVDGSLDEEGYVADVTYSAANDIVCETIKQIFARGINAPPADVAPRAEVAREILQEVRQAALSLVLANAMGENFDLEKRFAEIEKKYTDATDTNVGHK